MKLSSLWLHVRNSVVSRPLALERPKVIQFPVIDICNSRCQMCRIWENKDSQDITVEQLRKGLSSPLFSEVTGIGFNGGEPTLRADLSELVAVVLEKLPKLRQVSLITNAYKYKQVIEQIDVMGALIKAKGIYFDVMVSLDGYADVHDRVRGRTGNFANAQHVIDHICQSPLVDNVRIGCTVIRENVLHLVPLLEYCLEKGLYVKYRLGVPHQRLYTENLVDPYALTFEEKYELVEFLEGLIYHYEQSAMQRFFYRSLIGQIIDGAPRRAGCDWKHRGATITARGELAYCAVQSKALMPNIGEGDPEQHYFGGQAHLNEIVSSKCDSCHHDYVGVPAASDYRRLLLEQLEARLGLKRRLRQLPGVPALLRARQRKGFTAALAGWRAVDGASVLASTPSKVPTLMICGWYGTETLGDKAILGGVIHGFTQVLGQSPKIVLVALNRYISEMTRRQMPELRDAKVLTPDQALVSMQGIDYLAFGGGPLMAIDSMAPMQALFERAKQCGVKTVVAGCGVGPLGHPWLNQSIAELLQLADHRFYRDQRSLEYAAALGVDTTNDAVVEDPAFTWLAVSAQQLARQARGDGRKVLLLGLRDFPYHEYAAHLPVAEALAVKEGYERATVKALQQLVASNPELVIRPLPMCTNHFGADDRWFYRRLFRAAALPSENLDLSLLGPEMAPEFYCQAFIDADALLAMRFHSLVFGLSLGLPSVALDYTLGKGKVKSLAERYQAQALSMMPVDTDALVRAVEQALVGERRVPMALEALSFTETLTQRLLAR